MCTHSGAILLVSAKEERVLLISPALVSITNLWYNIQAGVTGLPQPHLESGTAGMNSPPESVHAPIAACLGYSSQCWQRAERVHCLTAALSVRDQNQRYWFSTNGNQDNDTPHDHAWPCWDLQQQPLSYLWGQRRQRGTESPLRHLPRCPEGVRGPPLEPLHTRGVNQSDDWWVPQAWRCWGLSMKSFLSLLAAYVAAGAFGVAFVSNISAPSHSGTQSYNRVIRWWLI